MMKKLLLMFDAAGHALRRAAHGETDARIVHGDQTGSTMRYAESSGVQTEFLAQAAFQSSR